MMVCICGHEEVDHVRGGRCRVPECPCERFQPVPQVDQRRPAPRFVFQDTQMARREVMPSGRLA